MNNNDENVPSTAGLPQNLTIDPEFERYADELTQYTEADRLQRFVQGELTFTEYQRLSSGRKKLYRRRHGGRPLSPNETRHRNNKKKKIRRRDRLAKQSRKRNRKRK